MISIRTILRDKPSKALECMIEGLIKQSWRTDFVIDMRNYGCIKGGICFGCAATCTIQQIANKNFNSSVITSLRSRAKFLNFSPEELNEFEIAMDYARSGYLPCLFLFLGFACERDIWCNRWFMTSGGWEQEIPKIRKAIQEMKEQGL